MADPVTLLTVSAIGSAVMGVGSAISGAMAQNQQAKAEENAANYNAAVARQQAENASLAANANEEATRRQNAVKMGAQRAALVESGMDISSGSGADLVEQSDLNSEMDALNIRYQGKLQSQGYSSQAALDTMNANAAKSRASSAWVSGGLGAASSVLSGVGNYARGRIATNGLTGAQ